MSEIIGIAGRKGSGKTTASKVMVYKHKFKEYSFAAPLKDLVSKVFDLSLDQLNDPELKETPFNVPREIRENDVYELVRLCSGLVDFRHFKRKEETAVKFMSTRIGTQAKYAPISLQQGEKLNQVPVQYQPREYKKFRTPRELLQFVGTDLVRDCISPYFWCRVLDQLIKNEDKVVIADVRFSEERAFIKYKKGVLVLVLRDGSDEGDVHKSETSLGTNNEYDYLLRNRGTVLDLQARLDAVYCYNKYVQEDSIYPIKKSE